MSSNLPATTDDPPDMFSDARLQLIRDNIAKDAPETVFRAMLEIARVRNLDPLAKQISVIKYGNVWQVTTTIDGYRAIAESTGAYAGSDEPQFGPATITLSDTKTAPEWASVTVWKIVHGQRVPFSARVYWDEYDGGNYTWRKMPRTMLAKVAESHALRKGFPKVLSGLYTTDEMDQAGPADPGERISDEEIINVETGEIIARAKSLPDAPQTRQDAPRAQMASERQRQMVRERWGALGLDPRKLDAQSRKWYGARVFDLTRADAEDMIRRLDQKITETSPRGLTPQPAEPSPAELTDLADDERMDDDGDAQVVAAIDADAEPTRAHVAAHYAS